MIVRCPRARSRRDGLWRILGVSAVFAVMAGSLVACGVATQPKIALLLPDSDTARYETFDRPAFEAEVAKLGDYAVLYSNADQDAAKQQQQAESALASGAKVLVLDAVDTTAAASIVSEAAAQGVPVIAYDRFIPGVRLAYYVSFDNELVGELQAKALIAALGARNESHGGILVLNGSATDSNAAQFRRGAQAQLARSGLQVLAAYDTPGWSPDKAQQWVDGQIVRFGSRIAGVYAANDGLASGAIAALKAAGVATWPIVTGQDAELSAVQRIVAGEQYMTVYKALTVQARHAAQAAVALTKGEAPDAQRTIDGTPATLLEPLAVTAATIADTVVAGGMWTVADICTPVYAAACERIGLTATGSGG